MKEKRSELLNRKYLGLSSFEILVFPDGEQDENEENGFRTEQVLGTLRKEQFEDVK